MIPFLGGMSAMRNEGVDLKSVFGKDVGHAFELAVDVTNVIRVPIQTQVMTPLLTTLGVPMPIAAKITSRLTGGAGDWNSIKAKAQAAIKEIIPDMADDVNPFLDVLTPEAIYTYAQGGGEVADILADSYKQKLDQQEETKKSKIVGSKQRLMEARRMLNAKTEEPYVEGGSVYGTPAGSRRSSVYYPE